MADQFIILLYGNLITIKCENAKFVKLQDLNTRVSG